MKQGISCQNSNPRLINSDYIYRKIHKKAKRQIIVIGFVITNKRSVVGFLYTRRKQNLDLISYVSVFILKMKFYLKFIVIGADNIKTVKIW